MPGISRRQAQDKITSHEKIHVAFLPSVDLEGELPDLLEVDNLRRSMKE